MTLIPYFRRSRIVRSGWLPWRRKGTSVACFEPPRPRPPSGGTRVVERALKSNATLAPWFDGAASGTLWVAFSGGMDSTVLLHALRGVGGVAAVHADHGINAASQDWADHCRKVSGEFGISRFRSCPLLIGRSGNLEHNARRARYALWHKVLAPGDVLALAHHADDQAQTRLWQLFTGRQSWGMPAERDFGRGRLVRPLLAVRRHDLAAYAERFGLRWIDDPSNADLGFDRNYIRHRVLPQIEARFPRAVERLALPRRLATGQLEPLPAADAMEWRIEAWLLAAGLPAPRRAVAEIHRQSNAAAGRAPRVDVTPGVSAWRHDNAWHLVPRSLRPPPDAPFAVTAGRDLGMPHGALSWRPAQRGLPRGAPLTVRHRQGGERIRIDGRGLTKAVKTLFRERRIPPWQRPAWPLLYDDADRLVAVPGLAIAEHAAVTDGLQPQWRPTSALTDAGRVPAEESAERRPPASRT